MEEKKTHHKTTHTKKNKEKPPPKKTKKTQKPNKQSLWKQNSAHMRETFKTDISFVKK